MLDKYSKDRNPFKVPENYFDNLAKDIMNSLPEKETKQTKKVVLWKKILPWTGVAALIALIAISIAIFDKSPLIMAEGEMQEQNEIMDDSKKHLAYKDIEDYLLFLEDEVEKDQYVDLVLNDEY